MLAVLQPFQVWSPPGKDTWVAGVRSIWQMDIVVPRKLNRFVRLMFQASSPGFTETLIWKFVA